MQVIPCHQAAASRWCHLAARWQCPPSPVKATHCPHPMEGTRVGCRATPEVMEQGGGRLPPTAPLPGCGFGSALPTLLRGQGDTERTLADVGVPTCGTKTRCQGWWRAQLGREPLASRAGSPSLEHAFLQAQGALGWLRLPGSSRAMVESASSPSIILISQRWQPGGPWQPVCWQHLG